MGMKHYGAEGYGVLIDPALIKFVKYNIAKKGYGPEESKRYWVNIFLREEVAIPRNDDPDSVENFITVCVNKECLDGLIRDLENRKENTDATKE